MRRPISIALLVLISVPFGVAEETLPVSGTADVLKLQQDARPLAKLFAVSTEVVVTADGMKMAEPPPDVLFARKADDGSLVTACISNEEAAVKFMSPSRTPQPARPLQR